MEGTFRATTSSRTAAAPGATGRGDDCHLRGACKNRCVVSGRLIPPQSGRSRKGVGNSHRILCRAPGCRNRPNKNSLARKVWFPPRSVPDGFSLAKYEGCVAHVGRSCRDLPRRARAGHPVSICFGRPPLLLSFFARLERSLSLLIVVHLGRIFHQILRSPRIRAPASPTT